MTLSRACYPVGRQRRGPVALLAAVVACAAALAWPGPTRARAAHVARAPESLADLLPAKLGSARREASPDAGEMTDWARGDYRLPATRGAKEPRALTVTLRWASDPVAARGEFKVHAPGERVSTGFGQHRGVSVSGHLAQLSSFGPGAGNGCLVLIGDRVVVEVRVEPATSPDESLSWLRRLDLRSIERFAATQRAAERARERTPFGPADRSDGVVGPARPTEARGAAFGDPERN